MTNTVKAVQLQKLFVALCNAGLASTILDAPMRAPGSYEFGVDDTSDARLFPSFLRTAYTAVAAAKLRESSIEVPAFDAGADGEGEPSTTAQPEQPLSYEQLQHYASAIYRMAQSMAEHEDTRWLGGIRRTYIEKDANGLDIAKIGIDHPVVPFDVWLQRELERTDPQSQERWYAFCLLAKQSGAHVPFWDAGVDEAKIVFSQWLNMVPWTRDDDPRTHGEKAVARSADSKWKAFKAALESGLQSQVTAALRPWIIMIHSPLMAAEIATIKDSSFYALYAREQALAAMEEKLARLELAEEETRFKAFLAAKEAEITARLAKLTGEQKPEQPKSGPTILPMPGVINSR